MQFGCLCGITRKTCCILYTVDGIVGNCRQNRQKTLEIAIKRNISQRIEVRIGNKEIRQVPENKVVLTELFQTIIDIESC